MSEPENNKFQKPTMIAPEKINLIRQSLLENVFKHYHELVIKLHQLPVQQTLPFLQKAYMDLDTAMVIFKEIMNTSPLVFPAIPKKESDPDETNPLKEPNENNDKQPEGEIKLEENPKDLKKD